MAELLRLPPGDLMALCESKFERDVLARLLSSGYRVRPQVGHPVIGSTLLLKGSVTVGLPSSVMATNTMDQNVGPTICEDVLERVGWRFWRCWASSFTIAPDAGMADLFTTLERLQIHPLGDSDAASIFVEHKTASRAATLRLDDVTETETSGTARNSVRSGDRVVIRYLDDNKTATFTLTGDRNDPLNGLLSVNSPLGSRLIGLVEEDETEFEVDGQKRRVLVVRTERQPTIH